MTVREVAYQQFAFKGVTHDHREALTESERKVFVYHKAGHSKLGISENMGLTPMMVHQHLRVVKNKGWI